MLAKIFCLMGPTASGKTALAFKLLERFPFEIISVDSALVYREMDIGTAKPTAAELIKHPHHLINIRNPDESFSAAEFCDLVKIIAADIFNRNKVPLLVGGTMMYFRALESGLAALPEASPAVRAEIEDKAARSSWQALHAELARVDAPTAAKIHAHDSQRIQRALEVFYLSGQAMSKLLKDAENNAAFEHVNLALFPKERAWLHARIAKRFEEMLAQGFLEEVAALLKKWQLDLSFPAMRTVGYRQAYEFLQANDAKPDFCYKGIAATRQLAKRQLTWLRHWPNAHYYACDDDSNLFEDALFRFIEHQLSLRR